MTDRPCLLPMPRKLELTEGVFSIADKSLLILEHAKAQELLFSATRVCEGLKATTGLALEIYAGHTSQALDAAVTLRVTRDAANKAQGYSLRITAAGIIIEAAEAAGIFYGCCTLDQLLQYYSLPFHPIQGVPPGSLPCLEIEDWPDFAHRGVMLDISRDKVPSMETTFDLVDMLASWKINQLQLYTEHTFAYRQHPNVWAMASPFTGEEMLKLDAFCRDRYIELVPNQNSFGHMERWLKLPGYKHLAEAPEGCDFPWGRQEGPFSLCPLDPESLSLLQGLYDELLPHFSSRQFNVGCDETFDLGQGRSKAECERLGTGRVYLDFLLKIQREVEKRGFRMQFWGDIIMGHPELVPELPKDSLALDWGYEADHPFDEHGAKFAAAGLPFYVCPGTSSWNTLAGRTDNCLGNLANAARNGLKHGATGYLITDWGDNGHWQVLPVSYLGFAAGGAYAWAFGANEALDIRQVLDVYAFRDPSGCLGGLAYDLGNIYRQVGIEPPNASALFHILQHPAKEWKGYLEKETAIPALRRTMNAVEALSANLAGSSSLRDDRPLLQREFQQTIALLRHACMRGLFMYGSGGYAPELLAKDLDKIVEEYPQIWLERNRPGGLQDSLRRFSLARDDYH